MIVWDSVLQVILLLCPAIIPGIACFVFRKIYEKQKELEEQRSLLLESFLDLTEETTEPEATAQQLLNAGVITAREARTLAGVETLELEPGKVKCEYCDSIVDAGTNCPNCGAVLPREPKVVIMDGAFRLGPTADDVVVLMDSIKTAPPLTQMRRW